MLMNELAVNATLADRSHRDKAASRRLGGIFFLSASVSTFSSVDIFTFTWGCDGVAWSHVERWWRLENRSVYVDVCPGKVVISQSTEDLKSAGVESSRSLKYK